MEKAAATRCLYHKKAQNGRTTQENNAIVMLFPAMNSRRLLSRMAHSLGCLLFITPPLDAQNLVPNPSFELTDTCPNAIGFQEGARPLHWHSWMESPEYFHACAGSLQGIDTLVGVPLNGFGFQYALQGEAYVGMFAYGYDGGDAYREYVGCQLLEPLEVGETYELSFYSNVAFAGTYWAPSWACNNMGMLFTMEPNTWTGWPGTVFALRNYAHLHSTDVIADTAGWTLVNGSFVADSAYQYLVIGNFFSNDLTDTLHLEPGNSLGAYYFVDGVCVRRAGESCEFTIGIGEPEEPGLRGWPNPTSGSFLVRTGTGVAWQVYDISGRLVEAGMTTGELLTISVDSWALGEYVLRLRGQEEEYVRFVVIR